MNRPCGVIAGVAFLLMAHVGKADDTHYRGVPIGAHAIALGGAFAGVADDASSAYFNPAGLARGGTVGLAGGLTINAWERVDVQRFLEQPDGIAEARAKKSRTVPLFIGVVVKFGPRDELEQKKFALALSVLEPIFSDASVFLQLDSDPQELTDTYDLDQDDRATWYGISFASRLNLKQSIGASMYLSVRKLNHSEVGLTLGGGMPLPDDSGGFVGTTTAANLQDLRFKAFHFVFRFGWLYRIRPQLQLGLMLQLPGIPLKQSVKALSQRFLNDNTDPSMQGVTFPEFSNEKVAANLPLPAELEAGLEYWPAEKVMLAFDASINSPVRSGQRVKQDPTKPAGGAFFADGTARRFIGNVAIAGDFYVGRKVVVETGFFTDLSSATSIPENPEQYQSPQINRFAGTLSLGLNVAGVALSVGSTVIYGKGDATGVVVDASNLAIDYTRTQATSRTIYLHITGATRAVTDLSDRSARSIQRRFRRKRRHGADSEEPETGGEDNPPGQEPTATEG